MVSRIILDKKEAEAIVLYEKGPSDTHIAANLGVSSKTVFNWRTSTGRPAFHTNDRVWDIELAATLYEQQLTDKEIGKRCGTSTSAINRWRHLTNRPCLIDGAMISKLRRQGLARREERERIVTPIKCMVACPVCGWTEGTSTKGKLECQCGNTDVWPKRVRGGTAK